jgi:hypothetical protein
MAPRPDDNDESWGAYRRLIVAELDRLNATMESIIAKTVQIQQDVALLKFQAAMWGAGAGALLTSSSRAGVAVAQMMMAVALPSVPFVQG